MKSHILTKKTRKRKRKLRHSTLVSPAMSKAIKGMIELQQFSGERAAPQARACFAAYSNGPPIL